MRYIGIWNYLSGAMSPWPLSIGRSITYGGHGSRRRRASGWTGHAHHGSKMRGKFSTLSREARANLQLRLCVSRRIGTILDTCAVMRSDTKTRSQALLLRGHRMKFLLSYGTSSLKWIGGQNVCTIKIELDELSHKSKRAAFSNSYESISPDTQSILRFTKQASNGLGAPRRGAPESSLGDIR